MSIDYSTHSGRIPEDAEPGEYSVAQFFTNGHYEYTRRWVSAKEAFGAFIHYTDSGAVKMGLVERVIITDGGDFINVEWVKDKGIVYPTREMVKQWEKEIRK